MGEELEMNKYKKTAVLTWYKIQKTLFSNYKLGLIFKGLSFNFKTQELYDKLIYVYITNNFINHNHEKAQYF